MSTQKFNDADDHALLQQFYNDHNNYWLGILLPRYTLLLLGVCMKYLKNEDDAKDAVQQIFLKTINELHKYKVDYFKSWIYMIAKNHCLMQLRDKSRLTSEINDNIAVNEDEGIASLIEKNNSLDQLNVAIQKLNKEQQLCVTMFFYQKKTYTEIAAHTGFNLLQVKSYIQNGKRNLKILLENKSKGNHG